MTEYSVEGLPGNSEPQTGLKIAGPGIQSGLTRVAAVPGLARSGWFQAWGTPD